jgi:hypothetical protein
MAEGVLELVVQNGGTSRKDCTVVLVQRICCVLLMRLAMISLTALSTNAVEIGSPRRRRAAATVPRSHAQGVGTELRRGPSGDFTPCCAATRPSGYIWGLHPRTPRLHPP